PARRPGPRSSRDSTGRRAAPGPWVTAMRWSRRKGAPESAPRPRTPPEHLPPSRHFMAVGSRRCQANTKRLESGRPEAAVDAADDTGVMQMRRTRRTVPAVALAALALLGSACGGDSATDDDSTSAAGDPASTEDSGSAESPPARAPLDGPISPCDLLLPEEVGHHLQMAIGEPAEDRVTGSCQYADALTTQLMPATDSPNASLDLALIGMGA